MAGGKPIVQTRTEACLSTKVDPENKGKSAGHCKVT